MKIRHTKRLLSYLVSAALLAGTTAPAFALSQDVRVGSIGFLEASQGDATSNHLQQIMSNIAAARTDLKNKQLAEAKATLLQAQTILNSVRNRYGAGTASVYISAKHKIRDVGNADIEQEPFLRSMHQLDAAKAALTEGRFDVAKQTVDAIDYPLVFASIDIPLSQTQASVKTALELINAGKAAAAQQVLEMAQNAIATSSGVFAGDFSTI